MTDLSSEMDTVKGALDTIEKQIHDTADKHFDEHDKNLNMDAGQKSEKFQDAISDFQQSISLLRKKFKGLEKKMIDISDFTTDFHLETDKLEELYSRDIQQRKKYFLEHERLNMHEAEGPEIDLAEVESIFDKIEAEEGTNMAKILMKLPNMCMIAVIAASMFVYSQLQGLQNKNRVD